MKAHDQSQDQSQDRRLTVYTSVRFLSSTDSFFAGKISTFDWKKNYKMK